MSNTEKLAIHAAEQRRYRQKLISRGRCCRCTKLREANRKDRTMCHDCALDAAAQAHERYARKKGLK